MNVSALEVVEEFFCGKENLQAKFEVGESVIYTAQFNNPGHEKPGDKLAGVVICVFLNNDHFVYRVRLDALWNERVGILYGKQGKQIVVGNVTEFFLALKHTPD